MQAANRRRLAAGAADIAVAALALWLVAGLPVAFFGGPHDDFLFVGQAASILHGHWLGPFNRLTLSKGPFFPLFLAACSVLRVSPQVGAEAVLLGASWLAADLAARLLDGRPPLRTLVFAILAANPAPLDIITTDLMREPLYAGLMLGVLALGGRLALAGGGIPTAAALGLVFAAFWSTRQEGLLLLPPLAFMAAGRLRRQRAIPWSVAVCAATLPLLAICVADARVYGVFRIDDMTAGPFAQAYGALARVGDTPRARYFPIPHASRVIAYGASPAAATLAPYLEGHDMHGWMTPGCDENPIPGCARDVQSGWFMWALRDAATAAGHYRSAPETDRFWRRVAGEINAACRARTIPCTARRDTLQPPLSLRDIGPILHEAGRAAIAALKLGPPQLGTYPSRGFADVSTYRAVIRSGPVAPAGDDLIHDPPFGGARLLLARVLCRVVPAFAVVLAPIGALLVAVLFAAGLGRRRLRPIDVFGVAVLLAISCRLLMLGVLSATAIRLQFRYVSPVFPLVLLVAAMPLALVSAGRQAMNGASTRRQVSSGATPIATADAAIATAGPQEASRASTH